MPRPIMGTGVTALRLELSAQQLGAVVTVLSVVLAQSTLHALCNETRTKRLSTTRDSGSFMPSSGARRAHVVISHGFDPTQVVTHPDLVGGDTSVLGIALVLPASGAAAGSVDRQPRHMHHRQPGLQQHRLQKGGDPAQDVDPDRGRA
jgi:hypothetical protein